MVWSALRVAVLRAAVTVLVLVACAVATPLTLRCAAASSRPSRLRPLCAPVVFRDPSISV